MLQFILGRAGVGKTARVWQLIRERAIQGQPSLLVVPEQFASTADLTGYLRLGDSLHTYLKVCSFRTLTGMIEDRFGGGALRSISDAGRMVLTRRALAGLGDGIVYFHRSRRSAKFCADCAETLQQLKYCGVSPELLETAAGETDGGRARRLNELAAIYRAYEQAREATGLEPVDRISRAAERVQDSFFEGLACFVDGFGEFTAPEAALLRRMLAAAPTVTVTLTCPDDRFGAWRFTPFAPAAATGRHLCALAAEAGTTLAPAQLLCVNRRFCSPQLAEVERRMAGAAEALQPAQAAEASAGWPQAENAPALRCYAADGPYDEAMYVAARAAALARAGVPYDQMVVVCRDPVQYLPALQYMFGLYGIPLFTGSTVSAEYAPMAVFLRAGLGLARNGLTGDGVLALLKTGLCGASEEALSALENYVYTWRPSAEEWRAPFTRNPAGMDAGEPGEAENEQLALAEELRARTVPVIEQFRARRGKTGRELSAALYWLLLAVGAEEVVRGWIAAESGQGLGGFDSARMWETVIGFLDEMASLLGDEEVTPAEYDDLLCVLLRAAEIGQAPHTQNQVQLAAADRMRLDNPGHVFVMGLNEGSFPAPIGDSPLLTNDDRARLSRLGAPLSGNFENMVLREQMNLYRAFTSARDSLTLTWLGRKNGVPMAVSSPVQQLCVGLGLTPQRLTAAELALTPAAALELLAGSYREDSPTVAALAAELARVPEMAGRLQALEQAAGRRAFAVQDTAALQRLLGRTVSISPSRMETYYECPFCYFMRYVLGVQPRPRAELGIPQSGTLVHWLLETLLRDFPSLQGLEDAALEREVRARIQAYAAEKLPGQSGVRFAYLLRRIGDNTLQLLRYIRDELAQGQFVPCAFEQGIGREDGVPALELTGGHGEHIRIVGTVDRVDTMTADGRTWLRVVDYKTGSKSFSLDEVCAGINTQMLLYLFTLTRNGTAQFGQTSPAGVLYLLSDPAPSAQEKKSSFLVDGLVVDDERVLAGMDRELSGRYLPVAPDSRSRTVREEKLVDLAMLGRIANRLEQLVIRMADALYEGRIEAQPLCHAGRVRCDSCDYRPVCRRRDDEPGAEVQKGSWKQALGLTAQAADENGNAREETT